MGAHDKPAALHAPRSAGPPDHGARRHRLLAPTRQPLLRPAAGAWALGAPVLAGLDGDLDHAAQVICAQAARLGPGSQSRLLQPLVDQTRAVLPIDRLLADADYGSEATHRWLREVRGIESIIPATGCHPGRAKTPYRRRLQRYFPRRKYGQRWMAETVYSVIKCKFGEALTARRHWQQVKQGLLRGLTYNLYRAVRLGLIVLRLLIHRVVMGSVALIT